MSELRDPIDAALEGLSAGAAALVDAYDVVGTVTTLLTAVVATTGATAAGVLVRRLGQDHQSLLATTSHRAEEVETYQVQTDVGPCFEAVTNGTHAVATSRDEIRARWPAVAQAFEAAGYRSVHATPMHWRGDVIGALNLFWTDDDERAGRYAELTQAFADLATVAIIHSDSVHGADVVERTAAALDDRMVIEQAKGVLAEQHGISPDLAFARLLELAEQRQAQVTETAAEIVGRAAEGDDRPRG